MNATNSLNNSTSNINPEVLNHPAGLFILFFTEMWERFSYYGMRALFVIFLVSSVLKGGWEWTNAEAINLYGWYIALVYLTPLFGGLIADKYLGFKKSVIAGALIMTIGHGSLALETTFSFYTGLLLLIIGNGLFKPNISSIVSGLYKEGDDNKRDGAYTIFYMGVNAGAFLGIMMCGYIGEELGYSWGFGLAGIFMFLGLLQFYFAQPIFEEIGNKPKKTTYDIVEIRDELRDPANKEIIPGFNEVKSIQEIDNKLHDSTDSEKLNVLQELKSRLNSKAVTDKLMVIAIFAFFTIFFWAAFEQAGGSMTVFAKDYTQRDLSGSAGSIFTWINTFLTVLPILVITFILALLIKQTYKIIPLSNFFISLSFIVIWGVVIWMIYTEFNKSGDVEIKVSWFGTLNSLFIITFAPLFTKLWNSKYNPIGPVKFAIGLILTGIGFAVLAFGSKDITLGSMTASVSIWWLIFAYWFHTMGELCISPVGLAYVSKLAPKKLLGIMFGVWYLSNFFAGKLSGAVGSKIDFINTEYGLSVFFLIFTVVLTVSGLLMFALTPFLKRRMHGIH